MRALIVAVVVLAGLFVGPTTQAADTTLPEAPEGVNSIIGPQPGQGVEPTDAGDRGGALQLATFVLIVGGLGVMGALIVRDIRKGQQRRTAG